MVWWYDGMMSGSWGARYLNTARTLPDYLFESHPDQWFHQQSHSHWEPVLITYSHGLTLCRECMIEVTQLSEVWLQTVCSAFRNGRRVEEKNMLATGVWYLYIHIHVMYLVTKGDEQRGKQQLTSPCLLLVIVGRTWLCELGSKRSALRVPSPIRSSTISKMSFDSAAM